MTISTLLVAPFTDFAFMQRALAACLILSLSGAPLGFFMNQRRMALVSDAMSHAIFPGVAVAFLIFGLNVWSLTVGGLIAAVVIALLAVVLGRYSNIKEDGVFTLLFLLSLTSGILLLSIKGSHIDILHMLFGDILAIDNDALLFMSGTAIVTLIALSRIYRGLVLDSFDPDFLSASGRGRYVRPVFFVLFVINLVAAFQALGTLMALGLMLLPAITATFWTRRVTSAIVLGTSIAIATSFIGLLVSYHANMPSSPMVVFVSAVACLLSVIFGHRGSVISKLRAS